MKTALSPGAIEALLSSSRFRHASWEAFLAENPELARTYREHLSALEAASEAFLTAVAPIKQAFAVNYLTEAAPNLSDPAARFRRALRGATINLDMRKPFAEAVAEARARFSRVTNGGSPDTIVIPEGELDSIGDPAWVESVKDGKGRYEDLVVRSTHGATAHVYAASAPPEPSPIQVARPIDRAPLVSVRLPAGPSWSDRVSRARGTFRLYTTVDPLVIVVRPEDLASISEEAASDPDSYDPAVGTPDPTLAQVPPRLWGMDVYVDDSIASAFVAYTLDIR